MMTYKEITVGRSRDCDISLDPRCTYASNHHGIIYSDGHQLYFKDTSTNGTIVNNHRIKHRIASIRHGDVILLAGKYPLNWNQIDSFFPAIPNYQGSGTIAEMPAYGQTQSPVVNTSKWNWGAFGLYPIWGFFNGCWWAILVAFFLGWIFPIPNIIFGIYGTKWSWENKTWISAQDFIQTQSKWEIWGIVVFCVNVLVFFWWAFVYAAFLFSY